MFNFYNSHWPLLLFATLWSLSYPSLLTAWPGVSRRESKDQLDPNVRDWGDYSDLPPGIEQGLGLEEDREHGDNRGVGETSLILAPELDFLGDFAGKKRLWVITAPSRNNHYLRMMEKQLEEMEQKGLNCRLAERDTFIITIIQNAMMEGRIQKTTFQGDATVESLDPDTVTKLLHYLELTSQEQGFTMLVLKKNLRVSERFPYPVRIEAILELIDQFPMRKLEKMTRKGSNLRCKTTKKKIVMKRKKMKKKMVLSPQKRGNVTSVVAQRKPPLDKKAALKSKVQDILSGRSLFVIRKGRKDSSSGGRATSNRQEKVHTSPSVSKSAEEVKKDRPDSTLEEGKRRHGGKNSEDTKEDNVKDHTQEKQSSKKKGKGKKGKKGKGRGKKSNREASEKDITALKAFLDSLKGTRRLMLISTPSSDATLYIQQKEENEKQHCDLAIRKITVATIVGEESDATLTLQHHQLESEPPLSDQSENFSDSGLISLLRAELGLSSPDLFSMTVSDYDIKPNRVFEAPPSSPALFEYIDNFPSRRSEKETEMKSPTVCSKNKQQPGADNSLLRFMSKRRLLLISAPSDDDYSFQQQLTALSGQDCHLGIRHFAMLKLTGAGHKASGTVELFPLNGHSQSEVEPLSRDTVNNLREQLKISKDYFSMLVVGKDGNVKAWFQSPMWSLDNIYDLVDSMELRHQEEKLQKRLGIHCPEDRGRGGSEEGHYRGYDEEGEEETYLYHRSEE
ncbi:coiled-coil domain-containing protein 80 isoform X1 [Micropterus salmoides]|uniref:coiled-coil domain-containing protein 80 isoform X1 n=1 Tax=Micropterus salmoides TaxID=27706 RepID=UPI0018ECCB37|nr:coiled-coil domain-containing protein 80 isoform X1 [Micropterus salmoides]XP_038590667.1 coiled-coil domain-containing protein 80 isoform X1 [Micropterus salmoides]XP_045922471.1 coiled-coil domain-containing protein 80 isoform X1 [Micropterus dolomieu]XP_045922472.1 coiled-coil domain-containing protein 80 isoform X1 [Micropterus dolomieu]XP_045922473.1 coiled-coil domain-containing protein 80 isoform X1 [Micropterus dolomieu]